MRILASILASGAVSLVMLQGCCSNGSGCDTCADDTRSNSQGADSECAVLDGGGDGAAGSSSGGNSGSGGSSGSSGASGSGGASGSAGTAGNAGASGSGGTSGSAGASGSGGV